MNGSTAFFFHSGKLEILLEFAVLRDPFFPDRIAAVSFRDTSHFICTQASRCAVVFFVALFWLCAPATQQFTPIRGLAALRAAIFTKAQLGRFFF